MGSGREALAGGSLGWARYAQASARRYNSVPVLMMLRRGPLPRHHRLRPLPPGYQEQAATCYQQSLALKRELGDRFRLATTLSHLGDTHHATGDLDAARDSWQ